LVVVQGPKPWRGPAAQAGPCPPKPLAKEDRWGSTGESRSLPMVEAGAETPVVVQGAKAQGDGPGERSLLVRFPKGAKALWSWCTGETVRRGDATGARSGPLAKMARGHRAHLVFALNDLFSLLSGCKIREALTFPAAPALRQEAQHIPALRPVGQILVTLDSTRRFAASLGQSGHRYSGTGL
jgi:hypothetical protein